MPYFVDDKEPTLCPSRRSRPASLFPLGRSYIFELICFLTFVVHAPSFLPFFLVFIHFTTSCTLHFSLMDLFVCLSCKVIRSSYRSHYLHLCYLLYFFAMPFLSLLHCHILGFSFSYRYLFLQTVSLKQPRIYNARMFWFCVSDSSYYFGALNGKLHRIGNPIIAQNFKLN